MCHNLIEPPHPLHHGVGTFRIGDGATAHHIIRDDEAAWPDQPSTSGSSKAVHEYLAAKYEMARASTGEAISPRPGKYGGWPGDNHTPTSGCCG